MLLRDAEVCWSDVQATAAQHSALLYAANAEQTHVQDTGSLESQNVQHAESGTQEVVMPFLMLAIPILC